MEFNNEFKSLNRFERIETINLALLGYIIDIMDRKVKCPLIKDATKRFNKRSTEYDSVEHHMKAIYNESKHIGNGLGIFKSSFKQPHSPFGRLNAVKNISLAVVSRPIRHAISSALYHDIDIVNCHPVILSQYCFKRGIDCFRLQELVDYRDDFFSKIQRTNPSLSKDDIKCIVLKIMYGGGKQDLLRLNDIRELTAFNSEMQLILKQVPDLPENTKIIQQVIKSCTGNIAITKSNKAKIENFEGKVLSRILQDIENDMLCVLESEFVKNGFELNKLIPIHDGLQAPRGVVSAETLECILRGCEKAIKDKLGYIVQLTEKPMEKHTELKFDIPTFNELEIKEYTSFKYNIEKDLISDVNYMFDRLDPYCFVNFRDEIRKTTFNSKEDASQYVLQNAPRVLYILDQPQGWLIKGSNGEVGIYSKDQLPLFHVGFMVQTKEGVEEMFVVASKMLLGPSIHRCLSPIQKVIFEPNLKEKHPYTYNIFDGFVGMPPVYNSGVLSNTELDRIEPLLNHIQEVLANDDPDVFDYIVSYIAHIIQKPDQKTKILMMFMSEKQQVGKNIFLTFIQKYVLGIKYAIERTGLEPMLDDKNADFETAILCITNEISIKSHNDYNIIKDRITSDRRRLRRLYCDPIEVNDYTNYICTSNERINSIRIEKDDARTAVFEVSDRYRCDYAYFDKILACFNTECGQLFYRFLYHYKITRQLRDIPFTKLRANMIRANDNSLDEFTNALECVEWNSKPPSPLPYDWSNLVWCKRTNKGIIKLTDLYLAYKAYCNETGEKCYKLRFLRESLDLELIKKINYYRLFEKPLSNPDWAEMIYTCSLCEYGANRKDNIDRHKTGTPHLLKYNHQ